MNDFASGKGPPRKKIIEQLGKDGKSWMPLAFENHAKYFGGIKGHEALEHNSVTEKLENLGTRDDSKHSTSISSKTRSARSVLCVQKRWVSLVTGGCNRVLLVKRGVSIDRAYIYIYIYFGARNLSGFFPNYSFSHHHLYSLLDRYGIISVLYSTNLSHHF